MTDRPRVLVVEDDPDVRALLVLALEDGGFAVTPVPDGASALAVGPASIDIVLLDLVLPDVDAAVLVERFRRHGGIAPVVAITAGSDPERASGCGAVGLVQKPFDIDTLVAAVRNASAGEHDDSRMFERKGAGR